MRNLSYGVQTQRVEAPAAAGTATLTTTWVDTQGWDGIRFVLGLGTLTTSASTDTSIYAQQSDNSDGSSPDTLTGTTVTVDEDADDNKLVVIDVYKPNKRYVAVIIDPGNQNIVFDLGIAELYGARQLPVAQHANEAHKKVVSSPAAA